MQNIEIKAEFPDLQLAKSRAESAGSVTHGTLHQIDTYFNVASGRLKLREINGNECQLIFYQRPDAAGPKTSAYQISPVPNPSTMKAVLTPALGVWKVVEKKRELYLHDEVRIHLDRVTGLGDFIELEGVVTQPELFDAIQRKVEDLMDHFGLSAENLVAGSYSDLLP